MNKKKSAADENKIRKRLVELSHLIKKHNIFYHQKDKPRITDAEYDALILENDKLEKEFHHQVNKGYSLISNNKRFLIIDASKSMQTIHKKIISHLNSLL